MEDIKKLEEEIERLKSKNNVLLNACKILRKDCELALSDDWDRSDEGFEASLEILVQAIEF